MKEDRREDGRLGYSWGAGLLHPAEGEKAKGPAPRFKTGRLNKKGGKDSQSTFFI